MCCGCVVIVLCLQIGRVCVCVCVCDVFGLCLRLFYVGCMRAVFMLCLCCVLCWCCVRVVGRVVSVLCLL